MAHEPQDVLVTAADSRYARLAEGLLLSVEERVQDRPPCFLVDLGLTPEQRERLEERATLMDLRHTPLMGEPGVAAALEGGRFPAAYLLSRFVRPWLPQLIPGFAHYLWMDADTWVQRPEPLGWFLRAAAMGRVGVVPEVHRAYPYLYQSQSPHKQRFAKVVEDGFGGEMARTLAPLTVLNTGIFAAPRGHALWAAWQGRVLEATTRAEHQCSDQAAFNVAAYVDGGIALEPLPASANFLCCHARPWLDLRDGTLREPTLPRDCVGILHLTQHCSGPGCEIPCSDGERREIPLDYLGFKQAQEGLITG